MEASLGLINLKLQLFSIESDAHAMQLIKGFSDLKCPPPSILYPYVIKAVESWGRTKGNKVAYKRATKQQATPAQNAHYMKMICGVIQPKITTNAEAMHILKECVRLISDHPGHELPAFLLPYVSLAAEVWGQTKGNKLAYKDTPGEWDELIWLVHFYVVTSRSDKKEIEIIGDAIDRVVLERPTVGGKLTTPDTLNRYYDRANSRDIKDDVERRHGSRQK